MHSLPRILAFPERRRKEAQEPDEWELIERCIAGDRKAMECLYLRYARRVYSLAARIAGEAHAEDLCQEIFVKVFRNLERFRGEAKLGTWIYRMTVNAAITRVTRHRDHLGLDECPEPVAPAAPDTDPRFRSRIERALAELPAGYRAVLVMHDVEGLSHEEIADILGYQVGTSKSQLHKARMKMRELLGPMEA